MRQVEDAEYDRLLRLDAAVRRVLAQRGDEVCWRDVYTELAGLVGVDPTPHLMVGRDRFLENCQAFASSMYGSGLPYHPVYVERKEQR